MMNEKQCKQLIVKGDQAMRKHELSKARHYYQKCIQELNQWLKRCRTPHTHIESTDRIGALMSMVVVSHHSMASALAVSNRTANRDRCVGGESERASQTYYLELAYQIFVDIVRDRRFTDSMRVFASNEIQRPYRALVSHYETYQLQSKLSILNEQYNLLHHTEAY